MISPLPMAVEVKASPGVTTPGWIRLVGRKKLRLRLPMNGLVYPKNAANSASLVSLKPVKPDMTTAVVGPFGVTVTELKVPLRRVGKVL